MPPQSKVMWQLRCAEFWPMQSNNVVRHQPGSACELLRHTSPGAAPQQSTLPLGWGRWRIPRYPTGGSLSTVNACVMHTSFLTPVSRALGMNKISPCMDHQFWDICANKDRLEKVLGRSGRPHNFSIDNDEFCYLNTKQEENLLVMSRPCKFWTEIKFFSLADCQTILFLNRFVFTFMGHHHPVQGSLSPESQAPD